MAAPYTPAPQALECVGFADFVVDVGGHRLSGAGGRAVPLRRAEFALLLAFLRAPGRVLSRDHLLDAVAGRQSGPLDRSIDVLVSRLRHKIEPDPSSPRLILTVPGVGYRFAEQPFAVPMPPEPMTGAAELRPRLTERRQLTVMLCGVGGAGAVSARLDPEDLAPLLPSYQEVCEQVIRRFGGMVARSVNDGVLGYFGYPETAEDDAEQAVRAGLAVIREVPSLDDRLRARIGIATGLAVVGVPAVLGEPIEVASHLLALAAPDTLVISARCQRLTGGLFEYEPLPLPAGAFACSERAFRVSGEAPVESRFEALHQCGMTPLFGRTEDLALLLCRWEQARSGAGKVILISGEPGIGKSRLVREFSGRISKDGYAPLVFSCAPHRQHSAYHPFTECLERAAGFGRTDNDADRRNKLQGLLQRSRTARGDIALLADLLSLKTTASGPDLTPRRRRERTMDALVGQVVAAAKHRPAVIVFEDVHWIDPTSHEVLDRLIDRIADLPILLIVMYRPEFVPHWSTRAHATTIVLNALDRATAAELVEQIAAGTISEAVRSQILDRADGVPLFIEEVTRAAIEVGGDAVSKTEFHASATVPATLNGSLTARLDRLGATARQVVQAGAAIGREFAYDLLAAIAGLPGIALESALQRLEDAELIHRRGVPPDATYNFRHALLRDAAYGMLLREPRRVLHTRIAEAIERLRPEAAEREPHLLAWHYTESKQPAKAIPLWRLAGGIALKRMALSEAIAHLNKGLDLIGALPPSPERDGRELELRCSLGTAWMNLGGWAAQELWDSLHPAFSLATSLRRNDALLPILYGFHENVHSAGRIAESLRWVTPIMDAAEAYRDRDLLMIGYEAASCSYFWLGELIKAREYADQMLSLYADDRDGHLSDLLGQDPKTEVLAWKAILSWMLGYPDKAVVISDAKDAHARRLGHPFDLGVALTVGARVFDLRREPHEHLKRIQEAERVGRENRLPMLTEVLVPIWTGIAWMRQGQLEQGVALLRIGLTRSEASRHRINFPYWKAALAEGIGQLGDLDDALDLIHESIAQIERPGWEERSSYAEILRIKGSLLARRGDLEAAERNYIASLDWARHQQAKSWELRTATSYARLMREQGRIKEAHDLLAHIYGWFTEGFGTKDLQEAKALLLELE